MGRGGNPNSTRCPFTGRPRSSPRRGAASKGGAIPSSPLQWQVQRAESKRVVQPRRPMQTVCDEHRAPACKSCKGHRGLRHCYRRHHQGHPTVMGGGDRCLPVQGGGGGCSCGWAPGRSEGRSAHRLPHQGEGGEVRQGRERRYFPTEARSARSRGIGVPPKRAFSPMADVLPRHRDTPGGRGSDRGAHRQSLSR